MFNHGEKSERELQVTDPADRGCGGASVREAGFPPRAKQRLALARVLIWAEREAAALGHAVVAERLEEAIEALYRDMD